MVAEEYRCGTTDGLHWLECRICGKRGDEAFFGLRGIQEEAREWRGRNFPGATGWQQLLGVVEETGELAHAFLKHEQGIRGTPEEHAAAIRDAVGDIVIFLMGFADTQGLSVMDCVEEAWDEVRNRNWKENPATGTIPKTCPICGGSASTSDSYDEHLRTRHGLH